MCRNYYALDESFGVEEMMSRVRPSDTLEARLIISRNATTDSTSRADSIISEMRIEEQMEPLLEFTPEGIDYLEQLIARDSIYRICSAY